MIIKNYIKALKKKWIRKKAYKLLNQELTGNNFSETRDYLLEVQRKPTESLCVLSNSYNRNIIRQLISIIIPAYNASSTIEECLNSVFSNQTKYNYEVLVIDDGSTDQTYILLDEYKQKHKIDNLKVIHQKNRGFSGARNRGIDEAKGEFFIFLDSDDVLSPHAIEKLMNTMLDKQFDIVEGAYYQFSKKKKNTVKTYEGYIDPMKLRGQPWGKIFKASLFDKIRFPLGYWYEDSIFAFLIYPYCKKCYQTADVVYGYRINPQGITIQGRKNAKCLDTYWIVEEMIDSLFKLDYKITQNIYEQVLVQFGRLLFTRTCYMSPEIKENVFLCAANYLNSNFPDYKTLRSDDYKYVEIALRKYNYKAWKLLCSLLV